MNKIAKDLCQRKQFKILCEFNNQTQSKKHKDYNEASHTLQSSKDLKPSEKEKESKQTAQRTWMMTALTFKIQT